MTRAAVAAIFLSAALLTACQVHPQVIEPTPVATTTVVDTEGLIPRFTSDIWPAVAAFNASPDQGSDGYKQYIKIRDNSADQAAQDKLRSAVFGLGVVQQGGQTQGDVRRDGNGLRLTDTSLTAVDSAKAALQVCYTFTATTFPDNNINHPVGQATASEATFELHKTDAWYLQAITNNHVVQGCSSSPKA